MKNQKTNCETFFLDKGLANSGKAPDGVVSLLAGIRVGHLTRLSSVLALGVQPQHIVPDRGEV